METIQVKLCKTVIFIILTIGVSAFVAGWLIAVNFSGDFENGYETAFFDIKSAVKESVKDGQQYFFMNGIRFCPVKYTQREGSADINVAGESENIEKWKNDSAISSQMQQRKMLIAKAPR